MKDIMNVNITQTCTDTSEGYCTEWVYSGRNDDIQVSIPMLEAMGLIILWIVVYASIIYIFKKFS